MRRNNIYSPTGNIANHLVAFQIAALLMLGFWCCETKTDDDDDEDNRRTTTATSIAITFLYRWRLSEMLYIAACTIVISEVLSHLT